MTIDRTQAERVYRTLREDIVSGRLAPGSKLGLSALMQSYAIGMAPLREALARLVGDHLVRLEGHRGFWVTPLSLSEFDDVANVRILLEIEMLRLSFEHGDPAWEERVNAAFRALATIEARIPHETIPLPASFLEQWGRANKHFHHALTSASGSPWLERITASVEAQLERYRRASSYDALKTGDGNEEHRLLVQLVRDRNVVRACHLLELHFRHAFDEIRETIGFGIEARRARA